MRELSLFGRRKHGGIRSASRVSQPVEDEDDDEYEDEALPLTANWERRTVNRELLD